MLKNDDGEWIEDQTILKDIGVKLFKKLYQNDLNCEQSMVKGMFPVLLDEDRQQLEKEVTNEEITFALFSMGDWKAFTLVVCQPSVLGKLGLG